MTSGRVFIMPSGLSSFVYELQMCRDRLLAGLSICVIAACGFIASGGAVGAFGEDGRYARPAAASRPGILDHMDRSATQRLRLDVGDRVFFAPGSTALGLRARAALARQAQWLKAAGQSAVIVGHADDGGSDGNNRRIAIGRARAVRDRLVDEGVPASLLHYLGKGRKERIAVCGGSACEAQNRRAVTVVLRQP